MAETKVVRAGDQITSGDLKAEKRWDSFVNLVTGLGKSSKDARLGATFEPVPKTSVGELDALYEGNATYARIVDSIPDHATREWISPIAKDDPEWGEQVLQELRRLDARTAFRDVGAWARHYGGAVILFGVDDGQKPDKPLDPQRVKDVRFLNVISRQYAQPIEFDRDPASPTFNRPSHYTLYGNTVTPVHRSRLAVFQGVESERTRMNSDGWGEPIYNRIRDALRMYDTSHDYAEGMLKDLNQAVAKIQGLAGIMAMKGASEVTKDRLELMNYAASQFNMILLDENESYERRNAPVTGLHEILDAFANKLAAATGIPISILFGQAPSGLTSDDASGKRTFYDQVSNYQEIKLRSPLEQLIEMISLAKNGPIKRLPPDWRMNFEPLETPDPKVAAERSQLNANTDSILIQNGVITAEEARSRLLNDPESPYSLQDVDLDDLEEELPEVEVVSNPDSQ